MDKALRQALVRMAVICEWLAMVLLVAATTLIMMEVFARGLFNVGLPWADELARYSGLGVIFLTVPLLLARDGHVKVDMFLNLLSGGPRRVTAIVNELLVFGFCVLFLVSCYWFMQRAGRFSTPAIGIPNLFYYGPAIVGMVLTTLIAAERAMAVLRGRAVPDGGPVVGTEGTATSTATSRNPPPC